MNWIPLLLGFFCAPAYSSETIPTIKEAIALYREAVSKEEKAKALTSLREAPPSTLEDFQRLVDLYKSNRQPEVYEAVHASLYKMRRDDPSIEPRLPQAFVEGLSDTDPVVQIFSIIGVIKLRPLPALSKLRAIAEKKFEFKEPALAIFPADSDRWWVQFLSLELLADWEGSGVLPLLLKKIPESPRVAGIAASRFWKEILPDLSKWHKSRKGKEREIAQLLASSPVPKEKLREVFADMLRIMRDAKTPFELRHQIAIKVGTASTDEDVAELLLHYESEKDDRSRLLYSVALFASRSKKAIPLLVEHVQTNPAAFGRAGALAQLKELMERKEYVEILQWVAEKDPDSENRQNASRQIRELNQESKN